MDVYLTRKWEYILDDVCKETEYPTLERLFP